MRAGNRNRQRAAGWMTVSGADYSEKSAVKISINLPIAATVLLLPLAVIAQNRAIPHSSVGSPSFEGATPPTQAVDAGFTTILVNQDFSLGILDLGCDEKSQRH